MGCGVSVPGTYVYGGNSADGNKRGTSLSISIIRSYSTVYSRYLEGGDAVVSFAENLTALKTTGMEPSPGCQKKSIRCAVKISPSKHQRVMHLQLFTRWNFPPLRISRGSFASRPSILSKTSQLSHGHLSVTRPGPACRDHFSKILAPPPVPIRIMMRQAHFGESPPSELEHPRTPKHRKPECTESSSVLIPSLE